MMDELLSHPEGKTLNFKRDLSSPKPLLKAIVAFANTAEGVAFDELPIPDLGVEDLDLPGAKRLFQGINALRVRHCEPSESGPIPHTDLEPVHGKRSAAIHRRQSTDKSHRLPRFARSDGYLFVTDVTQ